MVNPVLVVLVFEQFLLGKIADCIGNCHPVLVLYIETGFVVACFNHLFASV